MERGTARLCKEAGRWVIQIEIDEVPYTELARAYLHERFDRDVAVFFYDGPFHAVQFVKPGVFSLMLLYPHEGNPTLYPSISTRRSASRFLLGLDDPERTQLVNSLAGRSFPSTAEFPRVVTVRVIECRLGELQHSAAGEFVSFVIRRRTPHRN